MKSETTSETVNIASGETHSLKDIITLFEKATNHKLTIRINQDFVRKDEIERLAGDVQKLQQIIGISSNYTIDDVIKSFL